MTHFDYSIVTPTQPITQLVLTWSQVRELVKVIVIVVLVIKTVTFSTIFLSQLQGLITLFSLR